MLFVMSKRPNLIICMADELRWCEVGCYGNAKIRTPHIDCLAAEGLRFDAAVSNCPVCMPARSIVLSGQHARTCTGRLGNISWHPKEGGWIMPQWPTGRREHLPDQTLPEALRDAGYHTSAIGKWHVEAWPDAVGFDHYLIPAHQHTHSAQWFCEDGGPVFSPPGYSVDYEADRVEQFLANRAEADEPFFLYYNVSPPHMPLADAPEKYTRMYGRDDVTVRKNVDLSTPIENQRSKFLTYLWDYRYYRDHLPYTEVLPDGFDLVDLQAMYMGLTTWVDDVVGRMMASLEATGLSDDTIVIFTSDHGDNFGSFGRMGKGSLNEESIRVPMVARGPGVPAGVVSEQVASLVDLGPTLLSMSHNAPPAHMQGRDLTPVLRGDVDALVDNFAIIESGNHGVGVRTPTHLLGFKRGHAADGHALADDPYMFHDLTADPYELTNLAGTDQQADVAATLTEHARAWHASTPWMEEDELVRTDDAA